MKYKHLVKHNGVYYKAGEEVPVETEVQKEEVDLDVTKTDVNRMNVAELKTFATNIGIVVTEESTGTALKEAIITKLGL